MDAVTPSLNTTGAICYNTNKTFLIFLSFSSSLGCLYVILSFLCVVGLRQHPAQIIFGMSCYSLSYQVLFVLETGFNVVQCSTISPLVEFFMTGQESYLLMFAFDLILALKNPFAAEKERMFMYHLIAGFSSMVFALIAYADKTYALYGFCWMRYDLHPIYFTPKDSGSGLFFAVLIVFVYLFSLTAMLRSWKTLQKGLPDTFRTRKRILRHLKYYVGFFCGYWTVVLFLYVVYTIFKHGTEAKCRMWHILASLLISKGLVNAMIWHRTSNVWHVLARLGADGLIDPPIRDDTINWALRHEILTNTTRGICEGVDRAERQATSGSYQDGAYKYTQIEELRIGNNGVIFYDYAPHAFRYLRGLIRISSASYRSSMEQTTKERVSEGKSGAFFYFTEDRKYVVKTLTAEELRFLLNILPKYCKFLSLNEETLICRFLGCHAITMYGKTVHFVVIQSVFDTKLQIHERFDLKGSWVGRLEGRKPVGSTATCKFCSKEYVVGGSHDQRCQAREGQLKHAYDQAGKDLNWNRQMSLAPGMAQQLARQLIKDSSFLAKINSMDYSLLVGLHHRSFHVAHSTERFVIMGDFDAVAPFFKSDQGGMSVDVVYGPAIYYVGVIDILQQWNMRKRIERFIRVYIMQQDKYGISVIPPNQYCERFQERVVRDLIYDPSDRSAPSEVVALNIISPLPPLDHWEQHHVWPPSTPPPPSTSSSTLEENSTTKTTQENLASSPIRHLKKNYSSSSQNSPLSPSRIPLGNKNINLRVSDDYEEQQWDGYHHAKTPTNSFM